MKTSEGVRAHREEQKRFLCKDVFSDNLNFQIHSFHSVSVMIMFTVAEKQHFSHYLTCLLAFKSEKPKVSIPRTSRCNCVYSYNADIKHKTFFIPK